MRVAVHIPPPRSRARDRPDAAGGTTPSYDTRGNLASAGSTSYSYTSENLPSSASSGVTLAYDPLNRLSSTAVGSSSFSRLVYDGDALAAEYGGAGTLAHRYVHGVGADVPMVRYEGAGTAVADRRNLLADHQGSIVATSSNAGALIGRNAYDEYGIPVAANIGRFQYTGQIWLPDLGMYHYKARILSPTLGRFLQTDPIGYDDQFNLYAYVGNDLGDDRAHARPAARRAAGARALTRPGPARVTKRARRG